MGQAAMTLIERHILTILPRFKDGATPSDIVDVVSPRPGGWTPQGAARMAGKLTKRLRDEGLVVRRRVNRINFRYFLA